ncbi:MAG: ABC transporter ATP-binding protein [Cyanobacteria bacterium P01_D01_bin.44]
MSEAIAISIKQVSKVFKRYQRPADRLKEILFSNKKYAQEFWALRDISLEIPKGQTWGIVGRNGAGKSTLLKIITGTLQPTTGTVTVNGRIAALLELGSGFNPEFTGRQNVFFNGRILGLSQTQIEACFDAIAAFANIGNFLDQPVKTYSSGMRARLAFAVASSLEPDVLIVDEVLAVGDAAFQRKCFARMETIREQGCTILFVSHAMTSVAELCDHAVLIDGGERLLTADTKSVTSYYQRLIYAPPDWVTVIRQEIKDIDISGVPPRQPRQPQSKPPQPSLSRALPKAASQQPTPHKVDHFDPNLKPQSTVEYAPNGAKIITPRILNAAGEQVNILQSRQTYQYCYEVLITQPASRVRCGMLIKTVKGVELGGMTTHPLPEAGIDQVYPGMRLKVKFEFRTLLNPGAYFINAGISGWLLDKREHLHRVLDVIMFRIEPQPERTITGRVDFSLGASGQIDINQNVGTPMIKI